MQTTNKQPYSPTVRIHQSNPTTISSQQQPPRPMLAPSPFVGGPYEGYPGYLSAVPKSFKDRSIHKRASSGSSIASAGPPSPLSQSTMNPRIATSDATFSPSYEFDFSNTPQTATSAKSMPNPEMMFHLNNAYGAVDMRRIHSAGNDDRAYAGAQSVSSMSHDSPATPQTNYGTEYDDSKVLRGYPSVAYQQSLQDVFPNQEYAPTMTYPQMQQRQQRPSMMQDRLQAAQQDHLRINSPVSNPREKSPFRPQSDFSVPAPVQQRPMPSLQKQRTSISPKELMLDEHDIDETNYAAPLFPDQSQYAHRRSKSSLANSYIPYSQESSVDIPQQYRFVSQQSRQDTSAGLNDTPDFPAHLLSMESTNEDSGSLQSSQQSVVHRTKAETSQPQPQPQQLSQQRPVDTSSDAGTYSCTYHGCTLRFDSPAKLQKHKREGHRQHSPTSATQSARNSQAGPHRCERTNPSTGKPCNSVFSRPYDLTRHEDTIHNARKQKVRCHLCTEEKTFSRNDALTRHMRVVHPDVDWAGKQKRKSHK